MENNKIFKKVKKQLLSKETIDNAINQSLPEIKNLLVQLIMIENIDINFKQAEKIAMNLLKLQLQLIVKQLESMEND